MTSNPRGERRGRPVDPARLPPETAERLGRLTVARLLLGIAALWAVGLVVALFGFGIPITRVVDRLGPRSTCAQCVLADPHTVIVRGPDTVATIVELATLPPERSGEDSLRLYRARLRRGHSLGTDVVVATGESRVQLELRPRDSIASSGIVGRLFVEGAVAPVAVLAP